MTDEYVATAVRQAWDRLRVLAKEAETKGFSVSINNHNYAVKNIGASYFNKSPRDEELELNISKTVRY